MKNKENKQQINAYSTHVGADAPVCPNFTNINQNTRSGTGHRAQEPAAITLVSLVITIVLNCSYLAMERVNRFAKQ